MKSTDEMLAEMEQALAHHDREAARLRTMIAAAKGCAPLGVPLPQIPPPFPIWPGIVFPAPAGPFQPYVGDVFPYDGVFTVSLNAAALADLAAAGFTLPTAGNGGLPPYMTVHGPTHLSLRAPVTH